jgi:leader peptidase (prepilin peptidase)/N-methyltransferase
MVYLFIVFLLGLIWGSFVNAAVYRLREKMPLFRARSVCPKCKTKLGPVDLIPIISWLYLQGRCRYCGKSISYQYLIVELATGVLFVANYAKFFGISSPSLNPIDWLAFIVQLVFIVLLMIIFVYDLKFMEIPDEVVLPGIIFGLLANAAQIGLSYWQLRDITSKLPIGNYLLTDTNFVQNHLWEIASPYVLGAALGMGLAVLFYAIVFLSRERAMGGGDIKLAFFLGLVLPWPYLIPAIYIGFVLGSLVGIMLLVIQRKKSRSLIPLAPFLITGTFAAMFFGPDLMRVLLSFRLF